MKQLQTDECFFTRCVYNIIRQLSLTNEDLLINIKILEMQIISVPMQMRVYKSCCHPIGAMILMMYVDDNNGHYQATVALARSWPTTNTS